MIYVTRTCRSPGSTADPTPCSRRCKYHGIARYPVDRSVGQISPGAPRS